MPALTILAQADTQISFVVLEGCKQSCVAFFQALNPSHIAHKILALIALNGSPFLIRKVRYVVYVLISFTVEYLIEHLMEFLAPVRGVIKLHQCLFSHYSLRNGTEKWMEFDKKFLSWTINTIIKNSNITLLIVQLKNNFGLLKIAEVIFQYFR